jgi:hypothetical protein
VQSRQLEADRIVQHHGFVPVEREHDFRLPIETTMWLRSRKLRPLLSSSWRLGNSSTIHRLRFHAIRQCLRFEGQGIYGERVR